MSTPTGADGGQQPPDPNYGAQAYPGGAQYGAPQQPKNGFGIAALVLGIIGLILSITLVVWYVGGVLCIIAIVFGVLGRNRAKRGEATNKGVATGGLVTGIIGLVLAVLITIGVIIGVSFLTNSPSGQQLIQCQRQAGQDQAAQQKCGEQFGRSVSGS